MPSGRGHAGGSQIGSVYLDPSQPITDEKVSAWVVASKRISVALTAKPTAASVAATLDAELERLDIDLDAARKQDLLAAVGPSSFAVVEERPRPSLTTYIL